MIRKLMTIALVALVLAGCGESHGPVRREASTEPPPQPANPHGAMMPSMPMPSAEGPEVSLSPMRVTAPESWVRKQPRSPILLAEFSLPHSEGDATDGRLTITAVGGSIDDNVARWKGEFGGEPTEDAQEQLDIEGVEVTVIRLAGSYSSQHGMTTPGAQVSGSRMLAAIFSVADRQFIVKCYGPEKTMNDREEEFLAFLGSLKPATAAPAGSTE